MLYISTGKQSIGIYKVQDDLSLRWVNQIDLALQAYEIQADGDTLTYFTYDNITRLDCSDPFRPQIISRAALFLPVTSGSVHDNRLYTIGDEGLAIYELDRWPPVLVSSGGRGGKMLATDGRIVATSNGESVHVYYLGKDRVLSVDRTEPLPAVLSLSQNYPNPFNPITFIDFSLPRAAHVKLSVVNLLGQKVRTLVDSRLEAGFHTASWDGTDSRGTAVASGVYIYRIETGEQSFSKKMMLVR